MWFETSFLYSSSPQYQIGSESKMDLMLNITNLGEDAYETMLYVQFPSNVMYTNTELIWSNPHDLASVLCSAPTPTNGFVLKCDLGNPFMEHSQISLKTTFTPFVLVGGSANPIEIRINVTSSNPEEPHTMSNNGINLTIPVTVETSITLRG